MHKISQVNENTKMGICSVCGYIRVKYRGFKKDGQKKWACMTLEKAHLNKFKNSPKGLRYEAAYKIKRRYKIYGVNDKQLNILATVLSKTTHCECCGQKSKKLFLDHNHMTGELRGFICPNCNFGLGNFRDSSDFLLKAIEYLKNPPLKSLNQCNPN